MSGTGSNVRGGWQRWLGIFLLAIAYVLAAAPVWKLPVVVEGVSIFWPPAGVAVAALWRFGTRLWPGAWLGAAASMIILGQAPETAAVVSIGHALGPWVTVQLLKTVRFSGRFDTPRDSLAFAVAAWVGMTVPALTSALLLLLTGQPDWTFSPSGTVRWWLGDSLGTLLVAPFLMTTRSEVLRQLRKPPAEGLILGACLLGILVAAFFSPPAARVYAEPLIGLSLLAIVWASIRFGTWSASACALLVAAAAIAGTGSGVGPFITTPQSAGTAALVIHLHLGALLALMITAIQSERRGAETRLARTEQRWMAISERMRIIPWIMDGQGTRFTYVGPQAAPLVGYPVEEWLKPGFLENHLHPADRELAMSALADSIPIKGDFEVDFRLVRPSGEPVWFHSVVHVERGQTETTSVSGVLIDITAKRRSEELLRQSESQKASIVDSALDAIISIDRSGSITEFNPAAERALGWSREMILGRPVAEVLIPPESREQFRRGLQNHLQTGRARRLNQRIDLKALKSDGTLVPVELSVTSFESADGLMFTAFLRDITEQVKKAEEATAYQERLRRLIDDARDAFITLSPAGIITSLNPAFETITGWSRSDWKGRTFLEAIHPPHRGRARQMCERTLAGERLPPVELQLLRNHHDPVWIEVTLSIQTEEDKVIGLLGIARDISQTKRAEQYLKVTEARMAAVVENTPNVAIQAFDRHGHVLIWNPASETLFGFRSTDAVGKTLDELILTREGAEEFKSVLAQIARSGKPMSPREFSYHRRTGEEGVCVSTVFAIPGDADEPWFIHMAVDITAQKRFLQTIEESERRFDLVVRSANLAVWDWNIKTGHVYFNDRWAEIRGYGPGELVPHIKTWEALIHPEDSEKAQAALVDHVTKKTDFYITEYRTRTKSGDWCWIYDSGRIVEWDEQGQPIRMTGTELDITERKNAEAQRSHYELRLRLDQKLQAIGKLGAGIAHEYNNALAGILPFLELIMLDIDESHPAYSHATRIMQAVIRGKELSTRLLTFTKTTEQRLTSISFGSVIHDAIALARPPLPRTINIEVTVERPGPTVVADPIQIHQIMVNLFNNASDAMPEKNGTIRVEMTRTQLADSLKTKSALLPPGKYVRLTVSDTGEGMPEAVLERIFEAFFSTKQKDKGTGLGLFVVLGIMVDHGGGIEVRSAPGEGTAFDLYFPISEKTVASTAQSRKQYPPGKGERILLIDDEEFVLDSTRQLLARLGYVVTPFSQPEPAIELFRNTPSAFDLVLTDLTMPQMTGLAVSEHARRIRPDIPVVLSSGYRGEVNDIKMAAYGISGFLDKPFEVDVLANTVRRALEWRPANQPPAVPPAGAWPCVD